METGGVYVDSRIMDTNLTDRDSIYDDQVSKFFQPIFLTPHHILIIFATYFTYVKLLGPKMMSNRKPFKLKGLLMVYNTAQIFFNCHLLYIYIKLMGLDGLKFWKNVCHPVSAANKNDPQVEEKIVEAMYFYYVNKIIDLLDTVFFILRKKDSQVTFLHLFHHTTMVCSTWMSITYIREELSVICAGVNAFIHIVMYVYYLLANFGPSVQKYLWWKKYITKMQIVQFLIGLSCLAKMKMDGCQVNPLYWYLWTFNLVGFLGLFTHFYITSYSIKSKKA